MSSEAPGTTADSPLDPLIGAQLGEYLVQRPLGAGGMGLVYQGVQPVIGKPVAIKVLLAELAANPEEAQRLLTEARAVNAIRHRGIVDIFSFGQLPDGRHYLVMELLEGKPLDQVIAEKAPLDALALVAVLDEVLDALAAAHSAGVIHRDLKPNNVFIVTPPHGAAYVKLLDFGLAKQGLAGAKVTPQTRVDMVMGTPHYMAPEQARGQPVSPATDLYAAGCMTFEMATGRIPFDGATPLEVVSLHLTAEPPRLSSLVNNVSADLDDLVMRMLRKEPGERPQSARLLRGELRRLKERLQEERTQLHLGDAPAGGALSAPTPSPLDSLVSGASRREREGSPAVEPTFRRPGAGGPAATPNALAATLRRPSAGAGPVSNVLVAETIGELEPVQAYPTTRRLPAQRAWLRRWPALVVAVAAVCAACVVVGVRALRRGSAEGLDEAGDRSPPPVLPDRPPVAVTPVDPPPPVAVPTAPPTAVSPPEMPTTPTVPAIKTPTSPKAPPTRPPPKVALEAPSKLSLSTRVDKHLIPLKARETRGESINRMSLRQLEGIKDRIERSTAEDRAELAAELAEWEQRYPR